MRTPLALLALLLASAARAGTALPAASSEPASKEVVESRYYYHSSGVSWWGDVVSRHDISLSSDLGKLDELCLIPPAADWITDGASSDINRKYLDLIWRSAYSLANAQSRSNLRGQTIGTCGVNADSVMANIGEFGNFFVGAFDDALKKRTGFSSCLHSKDFVKGEPKYASYGKTIVTPAVAVVDTLNFLLKAKSPETVLEALGDVRMLQNSDKFRDSIQALVRDKSVTANVSIKPDGVKETLPLRVYAMRTLATIERTERSAKILALIWHDETEPPEMREGAIRAFAFIVEWPGPASASSANRPVMHKALYAFLAPLMMIASVENDKKEEAGAKAKLSALGNAAFCAAERYPKELRAKARKGEKY
ncbi:MAG: hypothetical protein PHS14_02725 [Elusimicrobia bacterium]|nr:hypothetical protein [Elusimicrobiota bacterium]